MRGKTLPSVYDLMNLDVVQFNDLNSKYDTELKRKVFLESEEGIEMSKRLKALKGQVLKYPFILFYHCLGTLLIIPHMLNII